MNNYTDSVVSTLNTNSVKQYLDAYRVSEWFELPSGSYQARIRVTPELAEYLFNHHNDRNRTYSYSTANTYKDIMSKGQWRPEQDPPIFGWDNNCIDGQHRLKAIKLLNQPIEIDVQVEADPALRETINSRVKLRNTSNYREIMFPEEKKVPDSEIEVVTALYRIDNELVVLGTMTNKDKSKYYDDYVQEINAISRKSVLPSGETAGLRATLAWCYRYFPNETKEFCTNVRNMTTPVPGRGDNLFARFTSSNGAYQKMRGNASKSVDVIYVTFRAFDLFLSGTTTDKLKVSPQGAINLHKKAIHGWQPKPMGLFDIEYHRTRRNKLKAKKNQQVIKSAEEDEAV